MDPHGLKERRMVAGIAGRLVSDRSGITRSRLCEIERNYVQPSDKELERIEQALAELIKARERVAEVASEVGWPM